MFYGQIVATAIAGTVQLGVQAWMFTNIPDICDPAQKDGFICPSTEVFGTASIIVSDECPIFFLILTNSCCSGELLVQRFNFLKAKFTSEQDVFTLFVQN
jgi:hypothetical protein